MKGRARPCTQSLPTGMSAAIVVFLAAASAAQGQARREASLPEMRRAVTQYSFQRWDDRDGLPQNAVQAVAQTPDGYMWFGLQTGMARFDGVRFTSYNRDTDPALRRADVLAMLADRDGSIWIGTEEAGLIHMKRDGGYESFTEREGLPDNRVRSIYRDRRGTLWVATRKGVARLADGRFEAIGEASGLTRDRAFTVAEDVDGVVWAGTMTGAARLVDGKFVSITKADGKPPQFGYMLAPSRAGGMWMSGQGGRIYLYRNGSLRSWGPEAGIPGTVISMAEDAAGDLWFGSATGLGRLSHGRATMVPAAQGATGAVMSLMMDAEGSIWAATYGEGIVRVRATPIVPLGGAERLPGAMATAVLQDHAGAMWIGTDAGVARLAGDSVHTYDTRRGDHYNDLVLSITETRDRTIWVGTSFGFARIVNGRVHRKESNYQVRAIVEDSAGVLWLGSSAGVVRYRGGAPRTFTTADGLADDFVMTMLVTRAGMLWVGTSRGLSYLEGDRFHTYTTRDGLPDGSPAALYEDAGGRIWVGTDDGLARVAEGRFVRFRLEDGLCDRVINGVTEDGDGRMWLSSSKGLFYLTRQELAAFERGEVKRLPCRLYGRTEGMRNREANGAVTPSVWRARDGRIWFPTLAGIAIVDPKHLSSGLSAPPVVVEDVLADGRAYRGADARVPAGADKVDIRYTALSFVAPNRMQFRYKLEGFDRAWTDAGNRRAAYYTNLPPGKYTFRVKAANAEGVWNEAGATMSLRILPFFYQTFWFRLALAAAFLLVVALTLARFARDLLERNDLEKQLRQAQKMEAIGHLAGGVAHDFNNLLTIIKGHTSLMLEEKHGEISRDDMTQIMEAADRASQLTQQLLVFSRKEAIQPRVFDLNDVVRALQPMLRRLINQNITIVSRLSDEPLIIYADPGHMEQVLLNLAVNARDAMPHGGRLMLETTICDWPRTSPQARGSRGCVELTVSDEGTGMTQDTIARIFEPFFTTKEPGKGTGLGLSTVYGIVKQSGGEVDVTSEVGTGSTFHVRLPHTAGAPAELIKAPQAPAPAIGSGTILLAEDEDAVRTLVARILRKRGYAVLEARSGQQALDVADAFEDTIQLLVTDMIMPELDGRALYERLSLSRPGTPVLFMSGYTDDEFVKRGLLTPGTAFIQKPFTPAELAHAVEEVLRAAGGASMVATI
jgi:signal transduction histidine kinase/ligand-binding sensor domain-containing protein/CheY-like chemotaxis protein